MALADKVGWNSKTFQYQHGGQALTPARLTSASLHPQQIITSQVSKATQAELRVTIGSDALFSEGN